ncbi:MAG TPA: TatD family hydrolase [Jatrophihabitantaceae bacterium]|jgi:TatD DNase family protein|nr:TatD family hydrolase [Jatrophihabitantaceae bacterium]
MPEISGRAQTGELAPPDPEPLSSPVFDAHTHLDAVAERAGVEPDAAFVEAVMARARGAGVTSVITVGTSVESSRWCVQAARAHPGVFAAVAVHPTEIGGLGERDYAELEELAADPRVVAIGETGLDYHWDTTEPADQQHHFRRHIDLAKRVGKPLMIHDREAHQDILRLLAEEGAPAKVVFHAFSGDEAFARRCVSAGYVLSFPGVVTFTNAPSLRAAAAITPPDQMLVETDAPFLTPHPYRGRPNAPYLLPHTLVRLAHEIGLEPAELSERIMETGARIFGRAISADQP